MPDIPELQDEFESLIEELERLKSINEITSSNSESAQKTIAEIDSFVKAVEELLNQIKADYSAKKKDLQSVEKSFNQALIKLVDEVDGQSRKYKELNKNFSKSVTNEVNALKDQWTSSIESHSSELDSVKVNFNTGVEKLSKALTDKLDKVERDLNSKVETKSNGIIDLMDTNNTDVLGYIEYLNQSIEGLNNRVKKFTLFLIGVVAAGIIVAFALYFYFF